MPQRDGIEQLGAALEIRSLGDPNDHFSDFGCPHYDFSISIPADEIPRVFQAVAAINSNGITVRLWLTDGLAGDSD